MNRELRHVRVTLFILDGKEEERGCLQPRERFKQVHLSQKGFQRFILRALPQFLRGGTVTPYGRSRSGERA